MDTIDLIIKGEFETVGGQTWCEWECPITGETKWAQGEFNKDEDGNYIHTVFVDSENGFNSHYLITENF